MNTNQINSTAQIAFIIGMGRSGTTLLTNILNSHPNIISTPENEFILFSYSTFIKEKFDNEKTINSFLEIFNYNYSNVTSIWKPCIELKESILNLKEKNYANACKAVYLNYPLIYDKANIQLIVDKNPVYSLHVKKLKRAFPDAKFIVITRDFRDNILSRKKHAKKTSLYDLACAWNYYYDKIKKSNIAYHLLRYEDLVENPEETLRNLCNYLGIEYTGNMLSFQNLSNKMMNYIKQKENNEVYNKIAIMHENLNKTINTKQVSRYKSKLTSEEISLLNYICYKNGKQFNYINEPEKKVKLKWIFQTFFSFCKIRVYYILRYGYYKLPASIRLHFLKANT